MGHWLDAAAILLIHRTTPLLPLPIVIVIYIFILDWRMGVAHRLSTIVNADNIVVIEHGTIVAQGKQEQLIRDCPLYAGMWNAHLGTQDSN